MRARAFATRAIRAPRRLRELSRRRRTPAPICESALAWAEGRSDVEVKRLLPAGRGERRPPLTIEPVPHPTFTGDPVYAIAEKYLVRVPGARLVGDVGLVVLPDGAFAAEAIYATSHLVEAHAFRHRLPRTVEKAGTYYSLLIEFATGTNYYHWLHDVVLRLHGILEHLPDDTRFVVPPNLRPFQLDALAMVGIDRDRVCEFDGSRTWRLEHLYFSPPTMVSGADSPAADAWLREVALRHFGIDPGPPRRRLYISRRDAQYRRIVNEHEVEGYLRGRGFECLRMDGLSLRDQVELFAETTVVVAAHGAAHTNMLFAQPGLTVIDVVDPSLAAKCYWNMSAAIGHSYWYVVGDTVPSGRAYAGDIHLPLPKLVRTLDAALASCGDDGSDR